MHRAPYATRDHSSPDRSGQTNREAPSVSPVNVATNGIDWSVSPSAPSSCGVYDHTRRVAGDDQVGEGRRARSVKALPATEDGVHVCSLPGLQPGNSDSRRHTEPRSLCLDGWGNSSASRYPGFRHHLREPFTVADQRRTLTGFPSGRLLVCSYGGAKPYHGGRFTQSGRFSPRATRGLVLAP